LIVFPNVISSEVLLNSNRVSEIATFEATSRNEIGFYWSKNQSPGDQHGEVRRRLRDCVLRLTSDTGESRFCILRDNPTSPQDTKQLGVPSRKGHQRYNWDSNGSFKNTMRNVEIGRCRLLRNDGQVEAVLEKNASGWWTSRFDGEELFSVGLDKSELLINLKDEAPADLPVKIAELHKKMAMTEKEREIGRTAGRIREDVERHLNSRIADFEALARRLDRLLKLHNAFLDLTITYEVEGIKFEVYHLDARSRIHGPHH
jgi:hypothetical protein